jgi:hypothetical protein
MTTTRWLAISALGALLVVSTVNCGGGDGITDTGSAGTNGSAGTVGQSGAAGDNGGQAGDFGGTAGTQGGGEAGTRGGEAGRQGGNTDGGAGRNGGGRDGGAAGTRGARDAGTGGGRDGGAAGTRGGRDAGAPRDATINLDAILRDANIPTCAADIKTGVACKTGTDLACTTAGGGCFCLAATWRCR